MTRLFDLASVLRSKNAGPLTVTLDIMCADDATFHRICQSGALSAAAIARRYKVSDNTVRIIPFELVRTIKVSLPRRVVSGDIADTDIYGCQQHMPLAEIEIP